MVGAEIIGEFTCSEVLVTDLFRMIAESVINIHKFFLRSYINKMTSSVSRRQGTTTVPWQA